MPGASDQELALARVYATAMLDLAQSRDQVDVLLDELLDFAARVEKDTDFETFLSSPMVDLETRRKTLEKLFRGKYGDLLVDSLQVLNRKGRLGLIRSVVEAYLMAREELRGHVRVHVRTAAPLTDELRARLKVVVDRHTGKEADLAEAVDESLIGGLVVRIGDEKFDTSIATKLTALAGTLLERASREIHGDRVFVEQKT